MRIFRVQMCKDNWIVLIWKLSEPKIWSGWWFGTMEFYDFPFQSMSYTVYGNVIIPTDDSSYFSEGWGSSTNQMDIPPKGWSFSERDSPWLFDQIWLVSLHSHIGSMVLLYMVTWIPSIYPLYVSIYTSTMDPMGQSPICVVLIRLIPTHSI